MPDPLDPQKFHIMSLQQKKLLYVLSLVFIFIIFPICVYKYYRFAITRPSQMDKTIDFEIKKGKSVTEISDELYKRGIINSSFLFNVYVFTNGYEKNLQAGTYAINPGVTIKELTTIFQHGVNDTRITFLEGWRVEEFAREASQKFKNIDWSDFVTKAGQYEGYLFPDTYYFRDDVEEQDLISTLRNTFDEKTKDILTNNAVAETGLTKEQVIILASIVEREVNSNEDRPIVAGILMKRLKEGIKLDADATTQYAIAISKLCPINAPFSCPMQMKLDAMNTFNWWQTTLSAEDINSPSPYNTRVNTGLPPTPISAVSLSSIKAILNSKKTEYYFYLTDSQGITHYAKTLEEHNTNIQKYLTN
jgi:UPF0755 protein